MNEYLFNHHGVKYPKYLLTGDAVKHIISVAQYFCQGEGLDIGGTKDWHYPGAEVINVIYDDKYDAYNLPDKQYDYIFSSHCLEHLSEYDSVLKNWTKHIKPGGVLFLYLPHPDQRYWYWTCPKHQQQITPHMMKYELEDLGYNDILLSGRDMYWSFSAVGFK